MLTLRDFNTGG